MINPGQLHICLASTSGGHLAELERLARDVISPSTFLVTVRSSQSETVMSEVPRRFVRRIVRNPVNFLVNALQAARILIEEKPDVIITTGAGDVVPLVVLGSLLGTPVVFAESIARIHGASLTGKVVRQFADLVLVPWVSLMSAYPKAVHITVLSGPGVRTGAVPTSPSILVLTGTGTRGFDRLLRSIDQSVAAGKLTGPIFAQTGESSYIPKNYRYARYLRHAELVEAIGACDVVVTHDGAGSMVESMMAGKWTLVVPRKVEAGELTYRSEAELASHLASLGWIYLIDNPDDIPLALGHLGKRLPSALREPGPPAGKVLAGFLRSLARKPDAIEPKTL